ncbi:Oligopeptide transport ATP-binding protein OppF [Usitatibacter rugosus]|uniref:Glutathione import ATP-binding protein GsiA n=1 Tax=Usitatibacter rugosus TaxID=2732067 RepID=A0A6M4GWI8_9PROT|nr:ABC transporter ATP-binding protein [Usitatibacter rugosus]QJR11238.1 Oligopeptide transport ATP-binding protein OppF [Usitatibacter rugosus]
MAMLDIRHLRVAFGQDDRRLLAVDDVSLAIEPGESYGLVGESGCGKSTLLRAVSGLNDAWDGEVWAEGERLGAHRSLAQRRKVQMVFQDPYGSLHPRHTIDAILREPIAVHGLGDAAGRILRALEQVGLGSQYRFRYPHQLSGGQRQRVAIARAMILEPKILLLDEPTSALDVSIQSEVLNLLADLRRDRGLTYLLVSHDLAVVAHLCSRVGFIHEGKLVEVVATERLRAGEVSQPYSRRFIEASRGYDRAMAASWEEA